MRARTKWIALLTVLVLAGAAITWRAFSPQEEPTEEPGKAVIYPEGSEAEGDIAAALTEASRDKKRVLLDFGGNWCGDCQVLEIYFHDASNAPLLRKNYVLVPVNIGRYDQNLSIAARYGVPVTQGVPALAVLDADGQVVYTQRHGEFKSLRSMSSSAVTEFLSQWKAGA